MQAEEQEFFSRGTERSGKKASGDRAVFKRTSCCSKARALCELKRVEKILIYPDHLEVLKKQGKCIIAAETFDMLY